jgi:outer membrane protein TolC
MINVSGVDTFTVGASTTLPVFSTPRKRALVVAGEAEVQAARSAVAQAERQADVDVRQALIGLEVAARHVRLHADRLIPLAELTLASTLAAYQTGRVDFTTVLQAARAVRDHHLDHQKYLAEWERRRADLEQAIGGDLEGGAR